MEKNILLTGQPGIGKTTAIKTIVDKLEPKDIGGFWSSEIREKGGRVGFAVETLSGKRGILAHVSIKGHPRVGKYGVNIPDIDTLIIPELLIARESDRIIIIDEIASMELFSKHFSEEVRRCLDTGRVLGTIQERRQPFLDEIRSRRDITLLKLTIENRDQLPLEILNLIGRQ